MVVTAVVRRSQRGRIAVEQELNGGQIAVKSKSIRRSNRRISATVQTIDVLLFSYYIVNKCKKNCSLSTTYNGEMTH